MALRTGLTTGVPLSKETVDDTDDRTRNAPVIVTARALCLTSAVCPEVAAASPRSRERTGQEATRAPRLHTPDLSFVKTAYYSGLRKWLVF
jgi:hypothetical protein